MVKKIVTSLLGTMVISSFLQAEGMSESKGFVGLEVGYSTIQADVVGFYQENNYEGTDIEYGFRIGAQNEDWRTMFVFNYFDSTEDNQNYEKGLLQLDYFVASLGSGSVVMKPFIGLNVGYMNYESDGEGITDNIDESGFVYGGQVGIAVSFSKTVDVDLMYRYSLADTDYTDHIGSIVLGVNYNF